MNSTTAPQRVLVVTAHPDDVDFGLAGTVAQWTRAGVQVTYCIVTNGDAGGFDPAVPRDAIGAIRQQEQTQAAACVGVQDLIFLGYEDGRVEVTIELRRDISRVIRDSRPDIVATHTPLRNWERIYGSHPDHLAVGEATLCAVYPDARNPFAHPELARAGHEAHTVPTVWIMGSAEPNHVVDISDTFELKVAALHCHESQVANRDPDEFADMLRSWALRNGQAGGLAEDRLGEAFLVIDTA